MSSSSATGGTSGRSVAGLLGILVAVGVLAYLISGVLGVSGGRVPEGFESLEAEAGEDGWATRVKEPTSGAVFRLVPSGRFLMGSPLGEPGRDEDEVQHWVQLTRPFYLAETETTQLQWQRVMNTSPSRFSGARNPVERVSWQEAVAYCEELGCTLPTEAQWEYACRAGTLSAYSFGEQIAAREASFGGNRGSSERPQPARRMSPMPVRSFPPNSFGLHDLHGNVFEWCADWFGEYAESSEEAPLRDPTGPAEGETRVLRGGSWGSEVEYLRSAARDDFGPGDRNAYFGFRAAYVP